MEFPTITEVLTYRNDKVTHRFRRNLSVSKEEADDIFSELLKWIWLCAKAQKLRETGKAETPVFLRIQSGMIVIDEMWHSFILHTRDYMEFCDRHFGKFIHHTPSHFEFSPPDEFETEQQLKFIAENLGGIDCLKKWYEVYAEKYSPIELKKLFRIHEFGNPCSSEW